MKKYFNEKLFCYMFNALAVVVFFILFYYCLGLTGENREQNLEEYISFKSDSVIINIIRICVFVLLLFYIGKISDKFESKKSRNALLGIVCILAGFLSILWVYTSKVIPVADQLVVCQYAEDFNNGDFSGFQKGGYLARYPQQLGMITLMRIIYVVFGAGNYAAFQYLSAVSVSLLVLSGCKIVRILSEDNAKVEIYYLLFMLFCFPMYAYTSFVYGDLISVVTGFFAVWMYLSCLKSFSWWRLVAFGISIGVSVQLRENFLILVIAFAIVTLIKLAFCRNWQNLIPAVALVLGVVLIRMVIWGFYHEVQTKDAPAIPALLFIVMGLNDDNQHNGWHNNYEYETFAMLNDDVELAKAKALEDLEMYYYIYKSNPDYMVDFFVRKMNAQWNAPMYQGIVMNKYTSETPLSPAKNIMEGDMLARVIEFWMKTYQLLMYGGILFLLIFRRKDFVQIEKYGLLITVFGGFLFSFIWEAKTRYVLPYLFMQIPYMAMGMNAVMTVLENRLAGNKRQH